MPASYLTRECHGCNKWKPEAQMAEDHLCKVCAEKCKAPEPAQGPSVPTADEREFTRGYVCAVAHFVSARGGDTLAREMLSGLGKVDWSVIDEYDLKILRAAGLAQPTGEDGGATDDGL